LNFIEPCLSLLLSIFYNSLNGTVKAGITGPPGSGGVLSPIGLVGPLIGKNVTDLDNIVKSKNAYVTVRTVDHQRGEIQGQILPTILNNINSLTIVPQQIFGYV
jgi:hypothetical protein